MSILKHLSKLFSKPQIIEKANIPVVTSNYKNVPIFNEQNDVWYQFDIKKLTYTDSDYANKIDYYNIPEEYRNRIENDILTTNIALNNFYDAYDPEQKLFLDKNLLTFGSIENGRSCSFKHQPLTDTGKLKKHPYGVICCLGQNQDVIWYFNKSGYITRSEVVFRIKSNGKFVALSFVISVKYKELQVTNVYENTVEGKKVVFSLK